VAFSDNESCIELFDKQHTGLFAVLNEQSNFRKATDASMVEQLYETQKSQQCFAKPKIKSVGAPCFIVHHYAGSVTYNSEGFLKKNCDRLHADVQALMDGSSAALIRAIFNASPSAVADAAKPGADKKIVTQVMQLQVHKKPHTVVIESLLIIGGSLLQESLRGSARPEAPAACMRAPQRLMDTLNSTRSHFIRCIKPNWDKKARMFEGQLVLEQLRYLGVVDAIKVTRQWSVPYPSTACTSCADVPSAEQCGEHVDTCVRACV
jgi:myosin heavy subunit